MLLSGCMPWVGVTYEPAGPVGTTSNGFAAVLDSLPRDSGAYRFYHSRDRRDGTGELEPFRIGPGALPDVPFHSLVKHSIGSRSIFFGFSGAERGFLSSVADISSSPFVVSSG